MKKAAGGLGRQLRGEFPEIAALSDFFVFLVRLILLIEVDGL